MKESTAVSINASTTKNDTELPSYTSVINNKKYTVNTKMYIGFIVLGMVYLQVISMCHDMSTYEYDNYHNDTSNFTMPIIDNYTPHGCIILTDLYMMISICCIIISYHCSEKYKIAMCILSGIFLAYWIKNLYHIELFMYTISNGHMNNAQGAQNAINNGLYGILIALHNEFLVHIVLICVHTFSLIYYFFELLCCKQ